jgi:hypothetical protein
MKQKFGKMCSLLYIFVIIISPFNAFMIYMNTMRLFF